MNTLDGNACCYQRSFDLMSGERKWVVLVEGDEAEGLCSVACNGCGKCALDAAEGLIDIVGGLAVIDYTKHGLETPEATRRCPTGAIAWVEGVQLTESTAVPATPVSQPAG